MEDLEIMVNEIYDNRESYKEIDYITIMNILKEAYLILNGEADADGQWVGNTCSGDDAMCEECEEAVHWEDGLCFICWELRWEYLADNDDLDDSEDENETNYT
jgi:hypothetical protein